MRSSDEPTGSLDVDMDRVSSQGAQLIIYHSRSLRVKRDTFLLGVPLTTRKGIFEYVLSQCTKKKVVFVELRSSARFHVTYVKNLLSPLLTGAVQSRQARSLSWFGAGSFNTSAASSQSQLD